MLYERAYYVFYLSVEHPYVAAACPDMYGPRVIAG
jgi:hypothetical protein